MMLALRTLLASILLVLATQAWAEFIKGYPDAVEAMDPRDVAGLPRYCKSTQGFRDHFQTDPNEVAHWYEVLGPAFHAMHHYCWALMQTNRAMLLARTAQVRDFYLENAVNNTNYVIRNSPPDFVMLPELYTKMGENLLRLNRTAQGLDALQKAIKAKPDYWPPYAALSDRMKQSGDVRGAREWLDRGLAAAPNTPALERRLQALESGKK